MWCYFITTKFIVFTLALKINGINVSNILVNESPFLVSPLYTSLAGLGLVENTQMTSLP